MAYCYVPTCSLLSLATRGSLLASASCYCYCYRYCGFSTIRYLRLYDIIKSRILLGRVYYRLLHFVWELFSVVVKRESVYSLKVLVWISSLPLLCLVRLSYPSQINRLLPLFSSLLLVLVEGFLWLVYLYSPFGLVSLLLNYITPMQEMGQLFINYLIRKVDKESIEKFQEQW